jgi:hypothetical protein
MITGSNLRESICLKHLKVLLAAWSSNKDSLNKRSRSNSNNNANRYSRFRRPYRLNNPKWLLVKLLNLKEGYLG